MELDADDNIGACDKKGGGSRALSALVIEASPRSKIEVEHCHYRNTTKDKA